MQITLELPDEITKGMEAKDLPRAAGEFRAGRLPLRHPHRRASTEGPGYGTRMQVHGSLKDHHVYLNYNREDLEQDMETLRQLRKRELARAE